MFVDLAVDSRERVHLSYHDVVERTLKYASRASGSWELETVDDDGVTGLFTAIAVDSSDEIQIVYYNQTKRALVLASHLSE